MMCQNTSFRPWTYWRWWMVVGECALLLCHIVAANFFKTPILQTWLKGAGLPMGDSGLSCTCSCGTLYSDPMQVSKHVPITTELWYNLKDPKWWCLGIHLGLTKIVGACEGRGRPGIFANDKEATHEHWDTPKDQYGWLRKGILIRTNLEWKWNESMTHRTMAFSIPSHVTQI